MGSSIVLNNVTSFQNDSSAVTTVNANSAAIVTALDNTLALDGTAPNQMQATLDMNSQQVLNLPQPSTANSPLRLQDLSTFVGGGTVTNIPPGGSTGQALVKSSNANFATAWSGVPISTGVTGLGTNVATFLGTPTSANLAATLSDETGSGSAVFATSPTLATPTLTHAVVGTETPGDNSTKAASTAYVATAISTAVSTTAPTIQKFTTGSGTYTTPANVKWLKVRMVGGGGGGGGGGSATATAATPGANTSFGTSLLVAGGGARGADLTNASGGAATSSLGTAVGIALNGSTGGNALQSGTSVALSGSPGGCSAFGGGGPPAGAATAGTGTSNTGGGGGGGSSTASTAQPGGGGGSGGYVDAIITTILSTYAFTVGAGGNGGSNSANGFGGGAGGSGLILVEEHYNF